MKSFRTTIAAGVSLAVIMTSFPASAQTVPGSEGQEQRPAYNSGPQFVLQHNNLDEQGRPRPLSIEDAIMRYGADGVQLLLADDQSYCSKIEQVSLAEARVRAAEMELRQAEIDLAQAETNQARKVAERRRDRARLNLIDILLGVASVGLGFVTGGLSTVAGIAYGGMSLANQGQSQIRRVQSDRDAELWYQQLQLYGQRLNLYDGRLQLYDLRMQIASFRGKFWDESMGLYCDQHVRPYDTARVSVSYDNGPASIAAPGTSYRWRDGDVLPTRRDLERREGRW